MHFDILIRGGRVVDGSGLPWVDAEVAIFGEKIVAVGPLAGATAATIIDATGRVVCPGFIDTHVHGDLPLLTEPLHEPSVRQGVTTHVIGQDGVAFAPASPDTMRYMRRYTAGFAGHLDEKAGLKSCSIAEFLDLYDRRCAINVCTLIPNGNVRMEVMGLADRKPTADELARMKWLVRQGMDEGAVGISSGLDYVPSIYADVDELSALCEEIAPYGGVYVTHMRGYTPSKAPVALEEVFQIGERANCRVHVSHFNCLADQVVPLVDAARTRGVDVTYDLYCYLYGSTIVGMLTLPPDLYEGGIDATLARLNDPAVRERLVGEFANPRFPIETIRLASLPHTRWKKYEGKLLLDAAVEHVGQSHGRALVDFVCDMLIATDMAAGCVIRHYAERQEIDIVKLMRHPAMMAGSDGIYVGGFPHPRGTGCFARYLGEYVRNGTWTLEEAVMKLSWHGARRFGLADRGLLRPGLAADVVVFDPAKIEDRSTLANGKPLASGVEDVIVNGQFVLKGGERTPALPGRGLKMRR